MEAEAAEEAEAPPVTETTAFLNRTIHISGDIDASTVLSVLPQLEELDEIDGDIRLVVHSEGGDEQSGYAIIDAIRMCRNRVIIDIYGSAMSIAAAIVQAGDRRRIAPNGLFMIHLGTVDEEVEKQTDVIDLAERTKKHNKRYYQILADNSHASLEQVIAWCDKDTYFTAEEAKEAGFVDEILKPLKKSRSKRRKRK